MHAKDAVKSHHSRQAFLFQKCLHVAIILSWHQTERSNCFSSMPWQDWTINLHYFQGLLPRPSAALDTWLDFLTITPAYYRQWRQLLLGLWARATLWTAAPAERLKGWSQSLVTGKAQAHVLFWSCWVQEKVFFILPPVAMVHGNDSSQWYLYCYSKEL